MVVDGESKNIPCRFVDDTESVSLAKLDVNNRPVNLRTAVVASNTIDSAGIRYSSKRAQSELNRDKMREGARDNTCGGELLEHRQGAVVPPVAELDDLGCRISTVKYREMRSLPLSHRRHHTNEPMGHLDLDY